MAQQGWHADVNKEGQNHHWNTTEDVDDYVGQAMPELVLSDPHDPED